MVLCQGLSAGNAQLLAFPGRSSSLKNARFRVKRDHFSARALRGMSTINRFIAVYGADRITDPTGDFPQQVGMIGWRRTVRRRADGGARRGGERAARV
jgi:hypothetical protein